MLNHFQLIVFVPLTLFLSHQPRKIVPLISKPKNNLYFYFVNLAFFSVRILSLKKQTIYYCLFVLILCYGLLHCFNQWVNIFGFQSKKEQQIIEQVNGWLLSNAEGRFIAFPFDDKQPKVGNIAGYRVMLSSDNDREHFYVYPKAFEEAIVGHQKEQASHILEINGMLKRGGEKGRYMVKLPHKIDPKRTRCYLLFPVIENDDPTDNQPIDRT